MRTAMLGGASLAQTTLTAVMEAPLRSVDPVITTSYIVRNYGYMVYDTLLAEDAQGQVQPQMLSGWTVEDEGKTYVLTLRDGLKWHDGKPVTSADAVQSIKRWIQLDKMSQIMSEFLSGIEARDEKTLAMPDAITGVNALRNGEIDLIEQVSLDLLPLLESERDVKLDVSSARGGQTELRFNFLHPPFNNRLVRQAALTTMDQKSIMQAQVGNAKYFRTCGAVFGCESQFPSESGSETYFKGDTAGAKALLAQAGYQGEPLTLLHPTDFLTGPAIPVIAQQLRQAGFKVNVEAMDWQTVQTRRTSKRPVSEGGWSILTTYSGMTDVGNPLSFMGVAANGEKAWFGWPDIPEIEQTRMAFAQAGSREELVRLGTELQQLIMRDGVIVPLGEFKVVSARRANVGGFLDSAVPVFWNVTKQ